MGCLFSSHPVKSCKHKTDHFYIHQEHLQLLCLPCLDKDLANPKKGLKKGDYLEFSKLEVESKETMAMLRR
jgi:hypothetical protein